MITLYLNKKPRFRLSWKQQVQQRVLAEVRTNKDVLNVLHGWDNAARELFQELLKAFDGAPTDCTPCLKKTEELVKYGIV